MRPAAPYVLYAALSLILFSPFLVAGRLPLPTSVAETQLGRPVQEPGFWFRPARPPVRVADGAVLLPAHLAVYNEGLKAGELRLWNPRLAGGLPIPNDTMVHPFYPPHLLLHLALPPLPAYGLSLLLHLFGAGCAFHALCAALGRSPAAALAGSLAWMFLGYNALWFSSGILLGVSVFAPLALRWIVLGFERRDPSLAGPAGSALGLAVLGSHPQFALHAFLFALAWIALEGFRKGADRAFALRFGAATALLAVGTGAAAVLARLDSIAHGWRDASQDLLTLWKAPVWPWLSGLVLGKALRPDDPFLAYEFHCFAGIGVVALALAAAVRAWSDPRVRFIAVFGAAALAVAFFRPLAAALSAVPILNLSPASRWIHLAGLCLCLLAARGVDALRDGVGRLPWILGGAVLLAPLAFLGRPADGALVETLIGFALAVGAAFAARRSLKAGAALGLAALAFELLPPFVFVHAWMADPAPLVQPPPAVVRLREEDREPWRATGLAGATPNAQGEFYLSEFIDGNNLLAGWGVENPAGFDAVLPASTVRFARAAGGGINPAGRSITYVDVGHPLLDLANLKYAFLPPNQDAPRGWTLLGKGDRVALYRNPDALPRARVVGRAVLAKDADDAVRLLKSRDFDARGSVILEGLREAPSIPPGLGGASVRWISRSSDRLELEADAPDGGILVLAEADYPGWEAALDGSPAPVFRANVAFRAVLLPPGKHRVELAFRPAWKTTGPLASIAFGLAAIAWPLLARRKR